MSFSSPEPMYVEARLRVHPTAGGGRAGPVFAGYRASWSVPGGAGERIYTDGAVYPVDEDELAPGATGRVRIYPLVRENWLGVTQGTELAMCEGPRVVGVATVERGLPGEPPASLRRADEAVTRRG